MTVVQFSRSAGPRARNPETAPVLATLDVGSTKICCMIAEVIRPKARGEAPRLRVLGFGPDKQGQEVQQMIGQAKGLWSFMAADPVWVLAAGGTFGAIALAGWIHKKASG